MVFKVFFHLHPHKWFSFLFHCIYMYLLIVFILIWDKYVILVLISISSIANASNHFFKLGLIVVFLFKEISIVIYSPIHFIISFYFVEDIFCLMFLWLVNIFFYFESYHFAVLNTSFCWV